MYLNNATLPICLPPAPNGQSTIIDAADFCYARSLRNHILAIAYKQVIDGKEKLCTSNKTKTLQELNDQLCSLPFIIRVHNSWLVNTHFIKKYMPKENLLIMKDDTKIPIGRIYKERLLKSMIVI